MSKQKKIGRPKNNTPVPKWFNLEKYEKAKQLNLSGWYEQLYVRQRSLIMSPYFKRMPDSDSFSSIRDDFFKAIKMVRETPIIDTKSHPILWGHFGSFPNQALAELKAKKTHYTVGIHSLTVNKVTPMSRPVLLKFLVHSSPSQVNSNFLSCSKYISAGLL